MAGLLLEGLELLEGPLEGVQLTAFSAAVGGRSPRRRAEHGRSYCWRAWSCWRVRSRASS
jgi:hypothetical protein